MKILCWLFGHRYLPIRRITDGEVKWFSCRRCQKVVKL